MTHLRRNGVYQKYTPAQFAKQCARNNLKLHPGELANETVAQSSKTTLCTCLKEKYNLYIWWKAVPGVILKT